MSFDIWAKLNLKITLLPFLICGTIFASDDVILITADRINSFSDKSSSDVRIIDSEEISKSSTRLLSDLLKKESDLNIISSGADSSSASLFLRGSDSSHTLVIIDGIIMNDPSNPNKQFDFGKLSLNNIDKIEILKGSQGLGFGSNAIGGVISITTKKAKTKVLSGESFFDYGSFKTLNIGTNFQKKINDNIGISFGTDFLSTEGYSAADEKLNLNADKDGNQRIGFDLNSTSKLSENYDLDTVVRYSHSSSDLDKGGGAGNDDPNDKQIEDEIYSKLQLSKNWIAGNAQTKFSYNFSKHKRLLKVLPDSNHPESSNTLNVGYLKTISANHTYYLSNKITQNLNIDFQEESDQVGNYNQNISGFLYHQYELESNIFNFGLRLDHNKFFNDHLTYKVAAGQILDSNLIKLSYSTGFRAPSLNQLFDQNYGNKDLRPEKSQSLELSIEKKWIELLRSNSTLFFTTILDRLSYLPNTFKNINLGKAEILGLENKVNYDWLNNFSQSLAFTLLKTRDLNLGQKLPRRPDVNIKNNFEYLAGDFNHFNFEFSYVGHRNDVDNFGNLVKMSSYILSNLNYRYIANSKNDFYLKIKNIFNESYEEIYGFGTGGRSITIGASRSY